MSIIVDGKAIAEKTKRKLSASIRKLPHVLGLSIFVVGQHPASLAYVKKKIALAAELGITVYLHEYVPEDGEQALEKAIIRDAKDPLVHGMILQLPLPEKWSRDKFIGRIPREKDVDVLTRESIALFRDGKLSILPPVVGAVQAILEEYHVRVKDKDALVVGRGRLVGQPISLWLRHNDAQVTMVGDEVKDLTSLTREADIIICGAGSPKLITPNMITEKTIIIDAGTSEDHGELVGDVDPRCKDIAHILSPVPGGVGPLTTVMLLKNLYILGKNPVT